MLTMIRDLCLALAVDVVADTDRSTLTSAQFETKQKTVYGEWEIRIAYDRAEGEVSIQANPAAMPKPVGRTIFGQPLYDRDPDDYSGPGGFTYHLPASWLPKPEQYATEMLKRADQEEE